MLLTDDLRLRIRGERRSVLDSLLSYAGAKDGSNGQTWGGVTQTGGRVQVEAGLGAGSAYAAGGYAVYGGQHVARNAKVEAGAGFSYPVYKAHDSELTTGVDLVPLHRGFDGLPKIVILAAPAGCRWLQVPLGWTAFWWKAALPAAVIAFTPAATVQDVRRARTANRRALSVRRS